MSGQGGGGGDVAVLASPSTPESTSHSSSSHSSHSTSQQRQPPSSSPSTTATASSSLSSGANHSTASFPVPKRISDEFKMGKTIGEGAFSKVKLAIHRKTGEKFAIKIIRKRQGKDAEGANSSTNQPSENGSYLSHLSKDVRLLQLLDHPNVIRLYQVVETDDEFYIIMQHAGGGEIIDHIARTGRLKEREARKFFRQIVSAIDHCHLSRVVHRDLKLENILLSEDKNILISDFGLGRVYQDQNLCNTFCGTPLFASPELVSGIKYPGPPADIWSLGVVLYAMVCGKPPFQAKAIRELYKKIKEVDYQFPEFVSDSFKDLISKIFVKDVDARITMDEIREHPWTNKGFDSPPSRVLPKISSTAPEEQLDQCTSIGYDSNAKIYHFHDLPGLSTTVEYPHHHKSLASVGRVDSLPLPPIAAASAAAMDSSKGSSPSSSGGTITKRISRSLSIGQSVLRHFLPGGIASPASVHQMPPMSPTSSPSNLGANPRIPLPSSSTSPSPPLSSPLLKTPVIDAIQDEEEHKDQLSPLPSDTLGASMFSSINSHSSSIPIANGSANASMTATATTTIASMDLATISPPSSLASSPPKSFSLPPTPLKETPASSLNISPPPTRAFAGSSNDILGSSPPTTTAGDMRFASFTAASPETKKSFVSTKKRNKPRSLSVNTNGALVASATGATGSNANIHAASSTSPLSPGADATSSETKSRSRSLFEMTSRRRGSSNVALNTVGSDSRKPEDDIRSVRIFTLAKTSSKKSPSDLLGDVIAILKNLCLPFEKVDNWVLLCTYLSAQNEQVILEIEICKVWLLSLYGISIKRISGSLWVYKELHNQISMQLEYK